MTCSGQHAFIRFPTLGAFQSHPFTICSLPHPQRGTESVMVLVARCHNGTTKTLFNAVEEQGEHQRASSSDDSLADGDSMQKHSQSRENAVLHTGAIAIPAVIDGPYGEDGRIRVYDEALLIAGGIGITRILPIILDVCTARRAGDLQLRRLKLVWSLRSDGLLHWFAPQLEAARDALKELDIAADFTVHITRQEATSVPKCSFADVADGRPDVQDLVRTAMQTAESNHAQSLHVTVCGPGSLNDECANAVSSAEWAILSGKSSLREIVLADEHFGY